MPQPPGYSPLPEYDALRRRLQSQYGQRRQEATDAIQRRYAANGMLNSGAYGKAQQKAEMDVAREQNDAESQLGFAEAQEAQRRLELQQQREFQTKEREATQQFASGERQAGQEFTRGMFNEEQAFKKQVFNAENEARNKELDIKLRELEGSEKANDFNTKMAMFEAGYGKGDDYDKFLYQVYGPSFREKLGMPSAPQNTQSTAKPAYGGLPWLKGR